MSREIKFRVWDSVKNEMISNDLICKLGLFGLAFLSSSDTKAMQCTGIKDKDGVDIYEGDIVSFMFLKTKVERKRGVVVFDVDELCYFIRTSSEWGYNHNLAWCDTEVIGNIYENPELLEAINEQGND